MERRYWIDISLGTMVRAVFVAAIVGLVIILREFLAMIFLAIIINSFIEPPIQFFKKRHIPRFVTVVIIYAGGIGVLAGFVSLVFPALFFELRDFAATFPAHYQEFAASANHVLGYEALPSLQINTATQLLNSLLTRVGFASQNVLASVIGISSVLVSAILIFVISFYLSLQENGVERFLATVTPLNHRKYVSDLWRRVQRKLSRWLGAQFILIIFIGTTIFSIFSAIGIHYALTIALIVAPLEMIPVIGPFVGAITIFLFVLFQNPGLALLALIIYVALEQIQQHLILPVVVSRALGLSPVIIISLLLAGAIVLGFWGALLAIPFGAILAEVIRDWNARQVPSEAQRNK